MPYQSSKHAMDLMVSGLNTMYARTGKDQKIIAYAVEPGVAATRILEPTIHPLIVLMIVLPVYFIVSIIYLLFHSNVYFIVRIIYLAFHSNAYFIVSINYILVIFMYIISYQNESLLMDRPDCSKSNLSHGHRGIAQ
jgi:hypothetical protein